MNHVVPSERALTGLGADRVMLEVIEAVRVRVAHRAADLDGRRRVSEELHDACVRA